MDDVRTDGALRFFVCNHDSAVSPCPHPCERDVQVAVGEGTAVLRSARRREVHNDSIEGLALCFIESKCVSKTKRELRTRNNNFGILWR